MGKSYFDRKHVPSYWWRYKGNNEIVIESDCNKYPIVAEFKYNSNTEKAIDRAQQYIRDLNAGRINPKNLLNTKKEKNGQ